MEMLGVTDVFGKPIGKRSKVFCRSKKNKKCYYKLAWVWIVSDDGKILVQKRARCKRPNPNMWDMSVAGHVQAGETPLHAASRETQEELGFLREESDFKFIGIWENLKYMNFAYIYLLKISKDTEFKISKKEVGEITWMKFDDFEKFIYADEFCPHDKRYKDWIVNKLKSKIDGGYFSDLRSFTNHGEEFLHIRIDVTIDRPLGSHHPKKGFEYLQNYGYVEGTISGDGMELDAYVLSVDTPLERFIGDVIAVIKRKKQDDDKLIVVPRGVTLTEEEIKNYTDFQEEFDVYKPTIIM